MSAEQFKNIDMNRLRSGHGVKWGLPDIDTLCAWVADMDFGIPPAVRDSVIEVTSRQDFGYPFWPDGDPVIRAFEERMLTRYRWSPLSGRTRVFTDLIQVLQVMIEYATQPGDGIAVHVPSYPPFLASIQRANRRIVPLPMMFTEQGWEFSTNDLARNLKDQGCTMLVLVNPQNPTGRVFRPTELQALADVADELDLIVLSDEIHADLTFAPNRHIPFASLGETTAARTLTATSATKAFNIAGMRCAVAHIGSDRVWRKLEQAPLDYFGTPSVLSRVATLAAWEDSDEWFTQLRNQLEINRSLVAEWAKDSLFNLKYNSPEATYLSWIDFKNTPVGKEDPSAQILRLGKVQLSPGEEFSQHTTVDTRSFARLNFATSESNLRSILSRINHVIGAHACLPL
ncbi:MAG: MalY/PatB family protein [Lacisediminihabitans sp.]